MYYSTVLRMTALRVNAVKGATETAVAANYTATPPFTAAQIGSVDFPMDSIIDAVVSSVGRLVRAYALVDGHPFRSYNAGVTDNIAHKGVLPSVDSNNKPIVGVYGAIYDADSGHILTEQPVQLIDNINGSTLKRLYYYYKIAGNRIFHTVTDSKIDVCVFSDVDQYAAMLAEGNNTVPLPDVLFDAAWAGAVAVLDRDGNFANQAQTYQNYFNNVVAELKAGAQSFQPAPTLINTREPAVS